MMHRASSIARAAAVAHKPAYLGSASARSLTPLSPIKRAADRQRTAVHDTSPSKGKGGKGKAAGGGGGAGRAAGVQFARKRPHRAAVQYPPPVEVRLNADEQVITTCSAENT